MSERGEAAAGKPVAASFRSGWLVVVMLCGCVAPRVFRAPEAPAAREARRPHFVRRRASKPARALRSLRRPPHQWGLVADRRVGSKPGQAPPPPTGTAAGPSGARGIAGASRAAISGRSLACCYKRRQSGGFFAENSGFWAQIDDVCNRSSRKGLQIAPV